MPYDIKRLMEFALWEKVFWWWKLSYQGPTDDDPDNLDECLEPSSPPVHIYSLDAPGLADVAFASPIATEVVLKHTFAEWVEMEKPTGIKEKSTNTFFWHSTVWLTKSHGQWTMDRTRSEIARGRITVDTPWP